MYEVVNRRMQRALAMATTPTGFAFPGQGAVTAGTGAELVIAAYPDGALIDGLYVENPDTETVDLSAKTNTNSNPRVDRLVMRLDMTAKTIEPFAIQGTPAASPQAPPLVKTGTVFDMPLCRYTMPGSASAQNPGSIVDERVRCNNPPPTYSITPGAGWSRLGARNPNAFVDYSGIGHLQGGFTNDNTFTPNGTQYIFTALPSQVPGAVSAANFPVMVINSSTGAVITANCVLTGSGELRVEGPPVSIPAGSIWYVDGITWHPTKPATGQLS